MTHILTHDEMLEMYSESAREFMARLRKGEVAEPALLVVPTPDGAMTATVPTGSQEVLTHAAYHLHLQVPPPVPYVGLVTPMLANINPDSDVDSLTAGALQAAYERGDERVCEAIIVMKANLDGSTEMMAYRAPLNEPVTDKPVSGGEGGPVDLLGRILTAMNLPSLG